MSHIDMVKSLDNASRDQTGTLKPMPHTAHHIRRHARCVQLVCN